MFPKLPCISKDLHNRLIISPENNEFTYQSVGSPHDIDGVDTLKRTKKMKAKTKTHSRNNMHRK